MKKTERSLGLFKPWVLAALFVTLPRHALAYPCYALASVLLIDFRPPNRRSFVALGLFIIWFGMAFLTTTQWCNVAPAGFLLELVLIFPLLIFVSGCRSYISQQEALRSIRIVNVICMLYSLHNLVDRGFPALMPYLDYLPDMYWGPYGMGGARIVTIFGFTGLLLELAAVSPGRWRGFWIVVSLANFTVPSYIIGIFCGIASLGLLVIKRPLVIIGLCLLLIPSGLYALYRLEHMNNLILELWGWHPKILAHIMVMELFSNDWMTLLTGTGLGQFTSTPQIWASEAFRVVSYQSVPSVPGLYSSDYHIRHVEPIANVVFQERGSLSSAFNKPYTGLTTLLAETGLLFFLLAFLFLKRARELCSHSIMALPFFAFFIALNTLDQWIDNLWLGYCLIIVSAFFAPRATRNKL